MTKDKPETSAEDFFPDRKSIKAFREAAADCQACELWKRGTQTVFGEGTRHAEIVFVANNPAMKKISAENLLLGQPAVYWMKHWSKPGIDRSQTYVTNVVKHFKWEPRGKRRIHKKPNAGEIAACRPWLEAEIGMVKPKVIVCLGATAARTLLGPKFKVSKQRGQFTESPLASYILATVHPSSILRAPDDETRQLEKRRFIDDLKKVARVLSKT